MSSQTASAQVRKSSGPALGLHPRLTIPQGCTYLHIPAFGFPLICPWPSYHLLASMPVFPLPVPQFPVCAWKRSPHRRLLMFLSLGNSSFLKGEIFFKHLTYFSNFF